MEQKEWGQYPPGAIIIEDEEAEFRKYYFGISGGYAEDKKQIKGEEVEEENIYEDHWNTGETCPFCGATKGEPHGEHKFV